MIIDSFQYGPYQVKIHKSKRAKRWAYRASLNDVWLDTAWMSPDSAAAYARLIIDRRQDYLAD